LANLGESAEELTEIQELLQAIPDFIKVKRKGRGEASKWYEGFKKGMVFKTGELGIGYYKDKPAKIIELVKEFVPMIACTPLELMISEILEVPPRTTPATAKERLRLSRDSPSPNGIDDLSWADDGSLSALSKQHWHQGLWAFDTCNANAWSGAKKYLEKTQADFVAVQEAKIPKEECADNEQAARNSGWKTAIGPCTITEAEGKSAGVAICGRTHVG